MQSTECHQIQLFSGEHSREKIMAIRKVGQVWPVSVTQRSRLKIQMNVVADQIITIN